MATDERFLEIPYAGVNPTAVTIRNVGLDSQQSNVKMACIITNTSYTAASVYCCNVNGVCYCFAPTGGSGYMSIRAVDSGNNVVGTNSISATYTVLSTNLTVYYIFGQSTSYNPASYISLEQFTNVNDAALAFLALYPDNYVNIRYVGNGCSLGGPSYVESGTGVVVPVTLPIGASLTADNISVTKNGVSLDFNYNPQSHQIAFTAI